jgi:hypothetical protein
MAARVASGRNQMVGKIALALGVVIGIFAAVPASADCASAMKANDQ